MKINIVIREGDLGWILGRLARELNSHLGWTINTPGADIDYCIPYYQYREATAPIKVPLFTHLEKDGGKKAMFIQVAEDSTYKIAMSASTAADLIAYRKRGTPLPAIIHFGSDLHREKVFGIVGKNYNTGRKNLHWVEELKEEFSINYDSLSGDIEDRAVFYSHIDYLIVTSEIEGGPMPVLDAIAAGVPIIAPDVGWCWDYPCIHYVKNNLQQLQYILRQLNTPRTWKDVALDHKKAFEGFK